MPIKRLLSKQIRLDKKGKDQNLTKYLMNLRRNVNLYQVCRMMLKIDIQRKNCTCEGGKNILHLRSLRYILLDSFWTLIMDEFNSCT